MYETALQDLFETFRDKNVLECFNALNFKRIDQFIDWHEVIMIIG